MASGDTWGTPMASRGCISADMTMILIRRYSLQNLNDYRMNILFDKIINIFWLLTFLVPTLNSYLPTIQSSKVSDYNYCYQNHALYLSTTL